MIDVTCERINTKHELISSKLPIYKVEWKWKVYMEKSEVWENIHDVV